MNTIAGFRLTPLNRRLLLGLVVFCSLNGCLRVFGSFSAATIYQKDFIQGYVLARALRAGVNPYLPLPELVPRWLPGQNSFSALPHATPHPIPVGWLCLPFSLLGYERGAVAWLIFELACLFGIVVLLLRWLGKPPTVGLAVMVALAALGWVPVTQDLWYGQLSLFLLFLLLLAWTTLREGRPVAGGLLLGVMIAVKFLAWPIVLFLALRRQWKAVGAAAATLFVSHIFAIATIGLAGVRDYYLKIGPMLAAYYRAHDSNFSAWTIGQRLFVGGGGNFYAPPLLDAPWLAKIFIPLLPVVLLLLGLRCALKAKEFDTSFALLVIVSVLVSPIAWTHYLVFAAIPLVLLWRRLSEQGFPAQSTKRALVLSLPLGLTQAVYVMAAMWFVQGATTTGVPLVPFAAGILTLTPLAVLVACFGLVWQSEQMAGHPSLALENAVVSEVTA